MTHGEEIPYHRRRQAVHRRGRGHHDRCPEHLSGHRASHERCRSRRRLPPRRPRRPQPSPSAAGAGDEVAPLGGVVQTVHVNVGQVSTRAIKLVSLEAMKMVTHVIARRGGKVISIAVKAGDPVDAGQVLLTIG
jgi:biotin carboxyl carrier protein